MDQFHHVYSTSYNWTRELRENATFIATFIVFQKMVNIRETSRCGLKVPQGILFVKKKKKKSNNGKTLLLDLL